MLLEAALFVVTLVVAFFLFRPREVINSPQEEKNEKEKEEKEKKLPMSIFFGSQSGTAETFAFELVDEAAKYGFDAEAIDLEDYEHDDLADEKCAVFLIATFGEGDPTDNAVDFNNWLMSDDREEDQLEGVPFAVFALGNRQYEHFCNVGRNIDKRLRKLGGVRMLTHGEGDDDQDLEEDYNAWKELFWNATLKNFGLAARSDPTDSKFKPSVKLEFSQAKSKPTRAGIVVKSPDKKAHCVLVPITVNRELRQNTSDGGSTRHLEVDISASNVSYITADNLGIQPRNDFKIAAGVAKSLGVPFNGMFTYVQAAGKRPLDIPSPCSVSDALLWYCDITVLLRASLLKIMAEYAEAADEKEKMRYLCSAEGKDEFSAKEISLYEIFDEFPSVNVPFADFIELCPKIAPRFYTISSSSKACPKDISVTVTISTTQKSNGRVHKGVCSTYMKALKTGDMMCCFVRASGFRLPKPMSSAPIIMVGPGTGIAPFRAFIQEANHTHDQGGKLGEMVLFFGCKKRDQDYIYKDYLEKAAETGVLSKLSLAFSREQDKKVYVQHRMAEEAAELWHLIHKEGAYLYVCGATSMGRSVKTQVVKMCQDSQGIDDDAAEAFVETLTKDGRYVQELWS